jgi:hypothetical protein
MKPNLHRVERHAERFGDLGVREALVLAQYHHGSIARRQPIDVRADAIVHFPANQSLLDTRRPVLDWWGIVNRHVGVWMRGAAAQSVVCRVRRDAIDPCREAGLTPELRKTDAHLCKDVLRGVVAVSRPDHALEIPTDSCVKLVVDGLKVQRTTVAGGARRHG